MVVGRGEGSGASSCLKAFLEGRPHVCAVGERGSTPGRLHGHTFVSSPGQQSAIRHIFKNLVSPALQLMEILSYILQTD